VTGSALDALRSLAPGAHVNWVVDSDAEYCEGARVLLDAAGERGQRPLVFGPSGSPTRDSLSSLAAETLDPLVDFLRGGPLDPQTMFRMFGEQVNSAAADGLAGLLVVADMEWLRPLAAGDGDVIEFEVLLDRALHGLHSTVVCAYRRSSLGVDAAAGLAAVHPVSVGLAAPPQFRLTAASDGSWVLCGELDVAVADAFAAAVRAAASSSPCVIDASGLEFADIAALRAIARAAARADVTLVDPPHVFRRAWELSGLGEEHPQVHVV
jgi:anti-anti-sigma regulatory factor